MKTKEKKTFDAVAFFRSVKEKLATKMAGMTFSTEERIHADSKRRQNQNCLSG